MNFRNIKNATFEQRSNLYYHMWIRRWFNPQHQQQKTFWHYPDDLRNYLHDSPPG